MRLEHCLLVSVLLHVLLLLPGWKYWMSPLANSSERMRRPSLQVHLQPPPARPAPTLADSSARPALPGQPASAPSAKPRPSNPPLSPTKAQPEPRVRAALPGHSTPSATQKGYPVSHPTRVRSHAAAPVPSDGLGDVPLDPPVMLKGPERIPVPPFLRNRDGQFLMTLRCRIEKDGSSRVEVMGGTGAPDLDESVRDSFSGLPWYRAEIAGQPLAVTVRLVIEGSWETGQDSIHWGGRIPPME